MNGRSTNEELVFLLERTYRPEMLLDEYAQGIIDVLKSMPSEDQERLRADLVEKLNTVRQK
jgi:hypothetical protein